MIKKEKYNLIIAIILFLLNIPLLFFKLWILNIIITFLSFLFFLKYALYNINILNEECNPEKFFELNKDKKSQILNCCFALFHSYSEDKKDIFLEYLNKAKLKKFKSSLYKMKLEYLELNFKVLNGVATEENIKEFEKTWSQDFLEFRKHKSIMMFLKPSIHQNMLSSVIVHFENGVDLYNTGMYELSVSEFNYVTTYGGTTIYNKVAKEYLNKLKNYKPYKTIKKDKIKLKDKYYFNKNLIDFYFCLYLILFIFIIKIGGIL